MRIAVITGASSGMGREFVLQLAKKEPFDEIWVIARSRDKLEALAADCAIPLRVIPLDLSDNASYDVYWEQLSAHQPEIGVLVNCAGYGKFGHAGEIPMEEQLGMIDLNCRALTAFTLLSLPYMKRGSKIVQVDSLSAFQPVPYMTVYGASKAYVLSYSRAMNVELKPRGIRVMAVSPGWVKTDFFDRAEKDRNAPVVSYMNVLYEPADVVRTAIRDLYHTKKDLSIHGFPVKAQVFGVKLLPHKLIMKIWMNQQKLDQKQPQDKQ